jgi:hypothetical protein
MRRPTSTAGHATPVTPPHGFLLGRREPPTYHDFMALTSEGLARPVRWSLWLGLGVLCGLSLGFAIGLAKPRMRK